MSNGCCFVVCTVWPVAHASSVIFTFLMNRFTENRTGVRFRRFTDTVCRQCACRQQRHYHDDCHHHGQHSFFHVDSPFHCRIPFRGTVASVLRIAPPPSDCSRRDSIYFDSISVLLYTPPSELAIEFSIFCHFDQNKAPHFSTFPAHKNKKQADARIRLFLLYLWQQYRCST